MSGNIKTFDNRKKDPDSVLDYQIDWSKWLDDDVITDSTWGSVQQLNTGETASLTPLAIDFDSKDGTTTTVWLSGGKPRDIYIVTNHITTAAGREEDAQITFTITNTF